MHRTCRAIVDPPQTLDGVLATIFGTATVERCGHPARYSSAGSHVDYCERHARSFIEATLTQKNVLGILLAKQGKLPKDEHEARRKLLRLIAY